MLVEHRLDLRGIDVLPARDDQVLQPAPDPVEALRVALHHVAGVQPAVDDRRGRRLVVAPVPGEDVRPAHEQLALGRDVAVDVRVRLAGVTRLPPRVLRRQTQDVRRRLRQPVALHDVDAALGPRVEERDRHRRAADDGEAQRRQVGFGEARLLRHEQVVRGHGHHRRHAALLDQLERARGVEAALDHDARPLPPREQRLHVPAAAVELRQHLEHDVVAADPGREVEREVRPEAVRLGEQRPLRLPRRARGVDEQEPVAVLRGRRAL